MSQADLVRIVGLAGQEGFLPTRVVELILAPICLLAEGSHDGPQAMPGDFNRRTLEDLFRVVERATRTPGAVIEDEHIGEILQKSGLADFAYLSAEDVPQYSVRADAALVVQMLARSIGHSEGDPGSPALKLRKRLQQFYHQADGTNQSGHQLLLGSLMQA